MDFIIFLIVLSFVLRASRRRRWYYNPYYGYHHHYYHHVPHMHYGPTFHTGFGVHGMNGGFSARSHGMGGRGAGAGRR